MTTAFAPAYLYSSNLQVNPLRALQQKANKVINFITADRFPKVMVHTIVEASLHTPARPDSTRRKILQRQTVSWSQTTTDRQ